jgi:hypothetical protein
MTGEQKRAALAKLQARLEELREKDVLELPVGDVVWG